MLSSPETYRKLRRSFDRHVCRYKKRFLPALLREQQGKCAYCNKPFDFSGQPHEMKPGKLTLDHLIPLGKGGTNTRENFVAACYSCNNKKGNMLPLNFIYKYGGFK